MGYQALYREWRPKSFDDLVGQEHIVTTLKNAVNLDRIAHAYLFSGPRGTGKTSVAKVFAKSLNCEYGPTDKPCGECTRCNEHDKGQFMDLMEIDAASNRGIDEIRELRDNVAYPPSEGRYKVYIVDEVHMLTTEAFNALLKTLEEPPRNVIFVLATTEPHKLPMTVLSRCQRFDFNRISISDIENRLSEVVENKEMDATQESLFIIAKKSDGGMRDALSLLDQCLSFVKPGETLKQDHVLEVTGSVSEEIYKELMSAVQNADLNNILKITQKISDDGKDWGQFLNDLILYMRDLLLVTIDNATDHLLLGSRQTLESLANEFEKYEVLSMIDFLSEKQNELKWSQNHRLVVEMSLYRLVKREGIYQKLEDRISHLEKLLQEGKYTNIQKPKEIVRSKHQDNNSEKEIESYRDQNTYQDQNNDVSTKKNALSNEKEETEEGSQKDEKKLSFEQIEKHWDEILAKLKKKKITAHAFIVEGNPIKVEENILYLGFNKTHRLHKERVEQKERSVLQEVLAEFFGDIKVKCLIIEESEANVPSASKKKSNKQQNDLIGIAESEFGPEKVEVRKNI
ncbi:DNA polymerase III subunit gamma/tau [Natranaerobius trueperi]|uniref:DNA-directed DNA polymerase n=1 Tax=Natranaerobius trueperi TaxID=759412 RepID=A0A226BX97_9FIRM|nr:DNA polymerase III subunit gamma/tau [Natranaerobius trueperi]OWZ83626.1 DNA polymerase III subunit gamma/tau [Natranaerobius trueperi]